jgi:eukaryotic-like serine/threonine-protein kinase
MDMTGKIVVITLALISLILVFTPAFIIGSCIAESIAEVKQEWKTTVDRNYFYQENYFVDAPIIDGELVLVSSVSSGGANTILRCLRISNGAQLWSRSDKLGSWVSFNGSVYVSATLSEYGTVYCLNSLTGAQIWKRDVEGGGGIGGRPVVADGIVYAATTGGQVLIVKDKGIDFVNVTGHVYAFNASTGTDIWNFVGSENTRFRTPVVIGEVVYVISAYRGIQDQLWSSAVYALNASNGEELWSYLAPTSYFTSLSVNDGKVYVTTGDSSTQSNSAGGILALNAQTGGKLWSFAANAPIASVIANYSRTFLVLNTGYIYAVNSGNGQVVWSYTTPEKVSDLGSCFIAGSNLYVGSWQGVFCFDASSGTLLWRFESHGYRSPVYVNGLIYIGLDGSPYSNSVLSHDFCVLDALDGNQLWNYSLDYTINTPAVSNGTIVLSGASTSRERSLDYNGVNVVLALYTTLTSPPAHPSPAAHIEGLVDTTVLVVGSVTVASSVVVGVVLYKRGKK